MDFRVPCECGGYVTVSEGAAGAHVNCSCGRIIDVPSLSELRERAGLPAHHVTAKVIIENMLANGELPTMPACVRCKSATDDTFTVTVECEKAWGRDPGPIWPIVWLFAWWGVVLIQREGKEYGSNLMLHLPIRMCGSCRRRLPSDAAPKVFRSVAFALVGAAVLITLVWTPWGGLLVLGLPVLAYAAKVWSRCQQAFIRDLLQHEPLYVQLLEEYADAQVMLNPEAANRV
jgi:hypothetical protein